MKTVILSSLGGLEQEEGLKSSHYVHPSKCK